MHSSYFGADNRAIITRAPRAGFEPATLPLTTGRTTSCATSEKMKTRRQGRVVPETGFEPASSQLKVGRPEPLDHSGRKDEPFLRRADRVVLVAYSIPPRRHNSPLRSRSPRAGRAGQILSRSDISKECSGGLDQRQGFGEPTKEVPARWPGLLGQALSSALRRAACHASRSSLVGSMMYVRSLRSVCSSSTLVSMNFQPNMVHETWPSSPTSSQTSMR